jgi:hypothetical protein
LCVCLHVCVRTYRDAYVGDGGSVVGSGDGFAQVIVLDSEAVRQTRKRVAEDSIRVGGRARRLVVRRVLPLLVQREAGAEVATPVVRTRAAIPPDGQSMRISMITTGDQARPHTKAKSHHKGP